jgi:hypothetical protein
MNIEKSLFCGREPEMGLLREAYAKISGKIPEPQVMVFLGESGVGKTRLAQEFYAWLSTCKDGVKGTGYWPDELDQIGNNLRVNPDLAMCQNDNPIPFLWWGMRLNDPGGRNQAANAAIIDGLDALRPHLEPVYRAIRSEERRKEAIKASREAMVDLGIEMIPLAGFAKTAIGWVSKINQLGRAENNSELRRLSELESAERRSVANAVVEDFTVLLGHNSEHRSPVVLLIDDGQFSTADPDVVDVLDKLLDAALLGKWPILFVITHWEAEWHSQSRDREQPSIARTISQKRHLLGENWQPLTLARADDLGPMLVSALPGITPEQKKPVLSRADGNPRFLYEIILFALSRPRFFIERDISKALTSNGLTQLLTKAVNLHALIRERLVDCSTEVQQAVALGSVQGSQFLPDLVVEVGGQLGAMNLDSGLIKSTI